MLGLAVFVLLAVLAGGIGFVAAGMDDDGDAGPDTPSGTNASAEVEEREPDDAPLQGNGDEPVAEVAEAVSPAVVQLEVGQGLGSGVVYDAEGLILTAAHVVQGSETVTVRFSDGTAAEGQVLGTNAYSDIAVVKIDPPEDLAVAALGDSAALQPGQAVVALGSPFGLDQTVTSGIVSAVNRPATTSDGATAGGIVNMVQTDAAINPGNSGGPLVDIQGRVIGINDQIFSQGGGNDGIGLAVPINLAVRVADTLAAGGEVQFGFLGVGAAEQASTGGLETGAVVAGVEAASAAAEAGLADGDRVLSIDGEPVGSFQELAGIISAEAPGTTVTLLVERGGNQQEIDVTLGGATRE
jgi:putative serine protease PepD